MTLHAAARPSRAHTVLTIAALTVLSLATITLVAFLLVYNGQVADGATRLDDGANRLDTGATELADNAARAQDGAARLADGAVELRDGANELAAGTTTLRTEVDGSPVGRLSVGASTLLGAGVIAGVAGVGLGLRRRLTV